MIEDFFKEIHNFFKKECQELNKNFKKKSKEFITQKSAKILSKTGLNIYNFSKKIGTETMRDISDISKESVGIECKERKEKEKQEIPNKLLKNKGVKIGTVKNPWEHKDIKLKADDIRHKILQGGTGCGKTTLAKHILVERAKKGFGSAYFENKDGDAIDDILRCLPKEILDKKVIVLDHSKKEYPLALGNFKEGDNIFEEYLITSQWLDFFINNFGIKDQFRTKELIKYACKAVFATQNSTLWDVVKMVENQKYREYILSAIDNNKYKDVLNWWNDFEEKSEKQQKQIAQSFKTRASIILSNPTLKTTLGQTPKKRLKYFKWMNEGKIILIRATGKLGNETIRNIMGLHMLGFWQAILQREDIPENKRKPFMIIADEPQTWLSNNEETLDNIFSKARSYKVGISCLFQSSTQIKQKSKELLEIILDNQPDLFQFKSDKSFMNLNKDIDISEMKKYHYVGKIEGSKSVYAKSVKPPKKLRSFKKVKEFVEKEREKRNKNYKQVLRELEKKERRIFSSKINGNVKKERSHKPTTKTSSKKESLKGTKKSSNSSVKTNW